MNRPWFAGSPHGKRGKKYASTAVQQQPTNAAAKEWRTLVLWLFLALSLVAQPGLRNSATSKGGATGLPKPALSAEKGKQTSDVPIVRVPVPLDIELFHLRYTRSTHQDQNDPHDFALVGSLESPSWNGLRILGNHVLETPQGQKIYTYPGPLVFRITASLKPPPLQQVDSSTLDAPARVDDLLFRLRFVVRVNLNLHQWQYRVTRIKNIGAPLGDAYPERTYEIVFQPPRPIPLTDVVCLDVYGPDGTHLAKFYLPDF